MLRIDSATQSLVCIQIPNNARCAVADLLRGDCIEIPSDSGYVRFEEADDFLVDVRSLNAIVVRMPKSERRYLVESIEEQMSDEGGAPLDHSFESLGAILVPEGTEDVVIETVEDADGGS